MKNRKILVGILVISLLMMSGAYAAWTQGFEVTSTVDTGVFDAKFTEGWLDWTFGSTNEYASGNVSFGDYNMILELYDWYPGANVYFASTTENVGTLPVVFESATVNFIEGFESPLYDDLTVNWEHARIFNPQTGRDETIIFVNNFPIAELETAVEEALAGIRLEPGDVLQFGQNALGENLHHCFNIVLPLNSGNDTELDTLKFEIKLNFKQHNQ